MTKEDLLKQIDEYEVVVNGKVSQAAFAYPPTPDLRSGGVVSGSTDLDMMQRPLGPGIIMPRSMLDQMDVYENNLRRVLISGGGFNVRDAADALAMAINQIPTP